MSELNWNKWLTKGWVVAILALFCCLLWGSAFPSIKIGYQLFNITGTDVPSQILFAGIRFTLAGVLTVVIGSFIGHKVLKPKVSAWKFIVILCFLQTVIQYFFFYVGLANTTGVKASIIVGTNVFMSILVAGLIFRMERITRGKIIGSIFGFAGIILINLNGAGLNLAFKFTGEGFILISTVAYALSAVVMKRVSKRYSPVMLSGYQFIVGGLIMAIGAGAVGGHLEQGGVVGVLLLVYMALLSAVAYSIWSILLKYNPVSRVAVYGFTTPMFGVLLSAIFLKGESSQLGLRSIVALMLVCVGIIVAQWKKKEI